MKKFLFGLAIFLCTASVFACEGKYILLTNDGEEECFKDCGEAKSRAARLLLQGKKSVRIDARGGITVNTGCDGKTYYSADDIK